MNPDCRDGKHDACNGDGWDGENVIPCVCPCHHDEGADLQSDASAAARGEAEVLHFAPWGSPVTSCGKPVPRDLATVTDRRAATTCEDCRSRFREDQR